MIWDLWQNSRCNTIELLSVIQEPITRRFKGNVSKAMYLLSKHWPNDILSATVFLVWEELRLYLAKNPSLFKGPQPVLEDPSMSKTSFSSSDRTYICIYT